MCGFLCHIDICSKLIVRRTLEPLHLPVLWSLSCVLLSNSVLHFPRISSVSDIILSIQVLVLLFTISLLVITDTTFFRLYSFIFDGVVADSVANAGADNGNNDTVADVVPVICFECLGGTNNGWLFIVFGSSSFECTFLS